METLSNAKLIPITETVTTINLVNSFDLCETLGFTEVNGYEKCLSLQHIEFGEVGFERKSDWMRFVNKLNKYDDTPIKRMITGDKNTLDWGGAIISRETINYSEDGFLIEFKNPTPLVVETIGENYLTIDVKKIRGQITWEWYHRKRGHEILENYAGICEIYLHSIEILK